MPELEIAVPRPQRWDEPFGEMTDDGCRPTACHRAVSQHRCERVSADVAAPRHLAGRHADRALPGGRRRRARRRLRQQCVSRPVGLRARDVGAARSEAARARERRRGAVGCRRLPSFGKTRVCRRCGQAIEHSLPRTASASREEDGTTRVFLQDVPRLLDRTGTAQIGPGEIFGELAALSRTPRTATVMADSQHDAAGNSLAGAARFDAADARDSRAYRAAYRENSLRVHLRETPLLKDLPAAALEEVAAATVFESYGNFDWYTDFGHATQRRRGRANCGRAAHRRRRRSAGRAVTDSLGVCARDAAARARAPHDCVLGEGASVWIGGIGQGGLEWRGCIVGMFVAGGGVRGCVADSGGSGETCGFAELRITDCGTRSVRDCGLKASPTNPQSEIRNPKSIRVCSIFSPIIAFSTARRRC